jgi:hypothetical protein
MSIKKADSDDWIVAFQRTPPTFSATLTRLGRSRLLVPEKPYCNRRSSDKTLYCRPRIPVIFASDAGSEPLPPGATSQSQSENS